MVMIILYALLLLIGLVLLTALFIKKEYKVERVIIIDQPVERVFDYILYLNHQHNYNKWWMADPHVKLELKGKDGTIGYIVCWDSFNNQLGKGEQEIKSIDVNHRIDFEIRFIRPFSNIAQVYMTTEPITDDITRFKWGFIGKNKFPLTLMNPLMDKLIGKDLAKSAANLKEILEIEIVSQ
jgi:uncharacterized protein YndB with AHSA1/START domain